MDTKTRPIYMVSIRKPLQSDLKTHIDWKWEDEKYIPRKWEEKKAGVAILISDKIDLKIKKTIRDEEGHYIMIKGSIQEEDITIVNIYEPNIGRPQYIRQTLTGVKGEIDFNTTIIVRGLNIPLSLMHRSSTENL